MNPVRSLRRSRPTGLPVLGLAILVLACADRTPAKIAFSAPPAVIVDNSLHALGATLVNAKGETLGGGTVTYSAAPEGIVEVSPSGALRCLRTGDASITLQGGGLGTPVPVKCRLPAEIVMPPQIQLILGGAPVALRPRALGEGGRPFDDVPVAITSSDPAVVAIEDGRAKPVAVGRTRVQASVGGVVAVTPVEVDEKVVSEPLALADGASRSWTLKEGEYLVVIDVKPEVRVAQGVTVAWTGANCEAQPEKPSHRVGCRVPESATLTVTNPRTMGVGARVTGTATVLRVPPA
jgi:hypothetical protein